MQVEEYTGWREALAVASHIMPPSHTTRLQAHLTTQLRPHQPPHTEPLQPARKELHTCQARTPASQKSWQDTPASQPDTSDMPERNSSQPGKDSGQPGEGLQTASKKLPPARKTLDGTHTSQLTSSQAHSSHRLTPYTSHFTLPQIYRSTSHRTIPHISHLTPHDDS